MSTVISASDISFNSLVDVVESDVFSPPSLFLECYFQLVVSSSFVDAKKLLHFKRVISSIHIVQHQTDLTVSAILCNNEMITT